MTAILKTFGSNRKIAGWLQSVPLAWFTPNPPPSYSSKLLKPLTDPHLVKNLAFKSYLSSAIMIVIILQVIHNKNNTSQPNYDKSENTLNWLTVAIVLTIGSHVHACRLKSSEIACFINGLIQFDQIYSKKPKGFMQRPILEKLSVVFVHATYVSINVLPSGIVFGLHWLDPHKATLAGHWLIPSNSANSWETAKVFGEAVHCALMTALVFSVNFWMWTFALGAACFVVAVIHLLSVSIIMDNIYHFEELCTNDKRTGTYGRRIISIYKRATIFRHIQILVGMLNEIQSGPLIIVLLAALNIIPSFTVAALVKSSTLKSTLIMLILSIDAALGMTGLLGGMAAVNSKSSQILHMIRWKRDGGLLAAKIGEWEKKFYRSCNSLRIKIGACNFVDEFTPLTCMHSVITLSANILLLGGDKL